MKTLLLITLATLMSITSYSQSCFTVKSVQTKDSIQGISSKRFTLGVKQITEEVLSEKYSICEDGKPVSVVIESIEAPTTGISIGPFEKKRKVTIVTLKVTIDNKDYIGVGESKIDVKSTFIELQDENIPFEKSSFSAGLKKALINAVNKI
jgi:hypothetical protein